MRLGHKILVFAIFVAAAGFSFFAASRSADWIEERTVAEVERLITLNGFDWARVQADGLQVRMSGIAPDEATRFRALSVIGKVADADRLVDGMRVKDTSQIEPPRFSVELLRNDDGLQLIGLIPAGPDREDMLERVDALEGGLKVTDMLNVGEYEPPKGWARSLNYGLGALEKLPRSKISIAADKVEITAISDSGEEKRRLEKELTRMAPEGLQVVLDISAPRPVITPFTLRFTKTADGAKFDACSADTLQARSRILRAAEAAGMTGDATCTIGLGVPSPNWSKAVEVAVQKLDELGGGTVTFSDADVSLVALDTTAPEEFDRIVGELETALPEVFSLNAVLPKKAEVDGSGETDVTPEFVASRDTEGAVKLRGRLTDERMQKAVESFAQAKFGSERVLATTRVDPDLPDGWPTRVLAGLDAMAELAHGSLVVQPEYISLAGETGKPNARDRIAQILADKLGEGQDFSLDVTYVEALDPLAGLPTPEECVSSINQIQAEDKILFAPGSADIDPQSYPIVDAIVDVLETCPDVPMEIGGHTDSQGRETMNEALSKARADAVLNALLERDVLTSSLTTRGYGEKLPIADNDTEEGREINRRIEFKLIDTVSKVGDETEAEASAGNGPGNRPAKEAAPDAASADATTSGPRAGTPTEPHVE
ncbi:OmpA family protein [Brevirhabdus sp.]|uniref:OmpA family protein n=1 Tax=Brevirhabdus sp. TaxID=2004514 RepID=UPI00405A1684